jgi:hypothetical protein
MSTIWTPSGEYVPRPEPEQPPASEPPRPPEQGREPTPEEMQAMAAEIMAVLQRPMSEHVVALADQLIQLATLQLNRGALTEGKEQPDLKEASLAIDTLGAIVDGVGARLGQYQQPLERTVDELRSAFVQVSRQLGVG